MAFFATPKSLRRVSETLEQLSDDVTDLKRAQRTLDLEFTELYDKVSHQMGRMAKRYATRQKVDEVLPEENLSAESVLGSDAISQKILARRAGGHSQ